MTGVMMRIIEIQSMESSMSGAYTEQDKHAPLPDPSIRLASKEVRTPYTESASPVPAQWLSASARSIQLLQNSTREYEVKMCRRVAARQEGRHKLVTRQRVTCFLPSPWPAACPRYEPTTDVQVRRVFLQCKFKMHILSQCLSDIGNRTLYPCRLQHVWT